MAQAQERKLPAVIGDLLANPQKFSFIQVLRLLLLWAGEEYPGGRANILRERMTFRPALSLGFAVTDVEDLEVELSRDPHDSCPFVSARVTATFLGLYGPTTPLPAFYTERLMDEAAKDRSVMRDFLDLVNTVFYQHFAGLFVLVFPLHRWLMEKDEKSLHMLMALTSFGDAALRERLTDDLAFLRYAGLFSQSVRSAAGLQVIMADAAKTDEVRIHCNTPRLARVPDEQRLRLGEAACTLSEDAVLGAIVPCHEGKFVIEFDRLDEMTLRGLLPGAPRAALLHDLVRNYCREPLEYDVIARLLPGEAQAAQPGGDDSGRFATLGHDVWLGFGGPGASAPLPWATAFFAAGFAATPLTGERHAC
ncbi:MAG: type VI secretion system baseplate subunit TssG [Desulfovibrio sp.]|jgi:type VI secretion system protein ImpH|nr:type VI secretion system baseplate subunit TssG [Desulfovibrio sp.]